MARATTSKRIDTPRRQRSDGERSRKTILEASARLATIEGLRGLSIGGLADHIGMSKSGLYAHFGSKEELQLATIDTAGRIFAAVVIDPAMAAEGAMAQLSELCERYLAHVESDVFPGGCFFAAAEAELDTHPGRVREKIADFQAGWMRTMVGLIQQAQTAGGIAKREDPAQLAFELTSMLALANSHYVMFGDTAVFARARHGIERRLKLAAPPSR